MKQQVSRLVLAATLMLSLAIGLVTAEPAGAWVDRYVSLPCSQTTVYDDSAVNKWVFDHADWVDAEYDRYWFGHWQLGFWDYNFQHYDGGFLCLR